MSENMEEVDAGDLEMSGGDVQETSVLPAPEPIILDDDKFQEEQEEREEAYSAEPEWRGKLLQPFSFSRKSLFYSQRVSMGSPHLLEVLGDSMAFLGDAMRILYLCSHDPVEYRHLRSKPDVMQDAIDQWGDELIANEDEALEAVTVAMRLYNASEVNKPEAVPTGGPGREEELGN